MSTEIKQRPIQQIELKKLKLNPKNPRKNDGAVDTIVKSIQKFGFNVPLFCDTSLTVYCGNTRLKAARKLKLKTVPCIIADDLTADEIREYALIDNKSAELAEWDAELLKAELAELDMTEWNIVDWFTGGGYYRGRRFYSHRGRTARTGRARRADSKARRNLAAWAA